MRTPDFLIIGGMKCGSTTLYRDLLTNPRVFFPIDKEPESLCHDEVLGDEGRAKYAAMFESAGADQLCAEASTAYTKRPDFEGVAERAKAVCSPDLKVIYLVRDPIKRIMSHHYHEYARGNMPESVDEAVRSFPALVNYSMYAMQVEPWIEALGAQRVRIIRFEDYVSDRAGWSSRLCEFLGIEAMPDLIEADKVFNKSEGNPVMRGPWRLVAHNPAYRRFIRPLMPVGFKDRLRGKVLPKAPPRPEPPSADTRAWVLERVRDDQARLEELLRSGVSLPV
jgi:sulfotransferase family protein